MKQNYSKKIIDDPRFVNFLNSEFTKTVNHATIEELAGFAFGSIGEAIEAYIEQNE